MKYRWAKEWRTWVPIARPVAEALAHWNPPLGEPEVHRKDCRCIGCIPKQPNDELYAKLKRNNDYWSR